MSTGHTRIYEAPPLILSRTADGRYIPVIEPWDPTRETASEAFTRALVITDMAIRARKERKAAAREQELLAGQQKETFDTQATKPASKVS